MRKNGKLKLILIGHPVNHSFSKEYFNKKFFRQQIHNLIEYENFPMKSLAEFSLIRDKFPRLIGANVTMPYKEALLPFVNEPAEEVKEIGNLNTLVFLPEKILGFNTDIIGLRQSLADLFPQKTCASALILGTGASAKTTAYTLNKYFRCEYIRFASRSPKSPEHIAYSEVRLSDYELIVNTTPLGMYPNVPGKPPLSYEQFTPQHKVLDLIYNPAKTLFLAEAEKQGARVMNGYKMLVEQAEASWKIWTKFFPELKI